MEDPPGSSRYHLIQAEIEEVRMNSLLCSGAPHFSGFTARTNTTSSILLGRIAPLGPAQFVKASKPQA